MADEPELAAPEAPAEETAPTAEAEQKPAAEENVLADQDGQTDGDGDDDDDDGKPKRMPGSQRKARQLKLAQAENAELRRALEQAGRSPEGRGSREQAKGDDDSPPKETDFGGDYLAYERALSSWNTAKAVRENVRGEFERLREQEISQARADARREAQFAHEERIEIARQRIPDFDQKMKAAGKINVGNELAAEIVESDKSALLVYYLAEHPDAADQLNALSGRELARAVGRLEARVHMPKPKTITSAPPPLSEVKGAASPVFNPYAKDVDMEAYGKWWSDRNKRKA